MAAKATFTGSARNKAIDVLPFIKIQALRIAMYPPCPSIPDRASAILHMTSALARITEKRTAPDADMNRIETRGEYPSPSMKLKAKNKRQKAVAFAERIKKQLQI
ncbi:NDMA-dependent alcohol dehydrogenase [Sesbania bispinosa]|nr:NDMA-dependent alcohol dehydrogenase [Sesbania bispinosa]